MTSTKYKNCEAWLAPVRVYNPELAQAVELLHASICLADDIADRALSPFMVSQCLWTGISGAMHLVVNHKEAVEPIREVLRKIYESEQENLNFTPGQRSTEEELATWAKRADLLDLYFTAWTLTETNFKTKENGEWFEHFKNHVLILDDCADILEDIFEDLHQCRRNYVVLKTFGPDGYFMWKEKKDLLRKAAAEIKEAQKLRDPSDRRMLAFTRGGYA